jgi:hypothetical protein
MIHPKFILETLEPEGDCLIIGKCTFHRELAHNKLNVKGGGLWLLDKQNSKFTLHGASSDFGKPRIQDIANCVQQKKVFTNWTMAVCLSDKFTFQYNDNGTIIDLETYN